MNTLTLFLIALYAALQVAQGSEVTFTFGAIASDGKGNFVGVQSFDDTDKPYQVLYSSDAVTWKNAATENPPRQEYNPSVIYVNETFVIYWAEWFEGLNISHVSQDGGKSFKAVEMDVTIGSDVFLLTNGVVAAIETDWNSILVSRNGVNWRRCTMPNYSSGWEWAASVLILVQEDGSNSGTYVVSQDGDVWATWEISTFGKEYIATNFFTGKTDNEIVAFVSKKSSGADPTIFTSTDLGKTWQPISSNLTGTPVINVYALGYYVTVVLVGHHFTAFNILISKDLETWYSTPHPHGIDGLSMLVPIEDKLFATLKKGYAFTTNLIDWTIPTGN